MAVKEVCRQGVFSEPTFYKWRAKYGGMDAEEARRLKELEVENARLKKLLAEPTWISKRARGLRPQECGHQAQL